VEYTNPSASIPETPVEPASPSSVAPPPAPVRRTFRPQMVAAAIVALLVVMIALSSRPSPQLAAAPALAQPEVLVPSSDIEPVPQPLEATPAETPSTAANVVAPRASDSSPKAPALKPQKNRIAESAGPREAVRAINEALGAENSTSTPVASESISAEPAPVSPAAVGSGVVTINGCLETSKDRFRLTDTDGVDAPRSRSWRTGFLKKHSNSVALVDPPDPHGLQAQVGQRVAAIGVMTDRELRVTSVRPIGARCN
jgi:hypothetical protein